MNYDQNVATKILSFAKNNRVRDDEGLAENLCVVLICASLDSIQLPIDIIRQNKKILLYISRRALYFTNAEWPNNFQAHQ